MPESVITQEMRNMVGVEAEPYVIEAEKGHIKWFAESVGDLNPLWQDKEYAAKSRYGGIVAPPTFLQNAPLKNIVHKAMSLESPLTRHLYAGMEFEFFKPIRPGDVITARSKMTDIYEKDGKEGKLLFMVFVGTITNQRGELLSKGRHTFVKR